MLSESTFPNLLHCCLKCGGTIFNVEEYNIFGVKKEYLQCNIKVEAKDLNDCLALKFTCHNKACGHTVETKFFTLFNKNT